jgi:hypothetical protein
LIGPWPKKNGIVEAPHNRRFSGKMECLPLWPSYIGEKGRTLGKTYGIRVRCYWEHLWGTNWEPIGNLEGEHVGNKGKKKKNPPSPTQNLKEKKSKHFECMLGLPHWLHEIFISKTIGHHFWPGLIPPL